MIQVKFGAPRVTKFWTDVKTGLEARRIKFGSGRKITVFGQLGFDVRQMLQLGNYGVSLIRDRVSRGIGSNDQTMPPLKQSKARRYSISQKKLVEYGDLLPRYAKYKQRVGAKPIRDLKLTGEMLGNIAVRSVSANQARIDISSNIQRIKARRNERRSPWWGWSPKDLAKLAFAARETFRTNLSFSVGSGRSNAAFGSSSIWMRPWLHNYGAQVEAKETRRVA